MNAAGGTVTSLSSRQAYQPDMDAMARDRVRCARESLGLDHAAFAEVLAPLLRQAPRPALIRAWETKVTPPGDVVEAARIAQHGAGGTVPGMQPGQYAGVTAVYASRSDFLADMPPGDLFAGATLIRASGLSLNMICQMYATEALRAMLEDGTEMRLLFLAPGCPAMHDREAEESYPPGTLDALTALNIGIMDSQVRAKLTPAAAARLQMALASEPLRFNLLFIDGGLCVAQPYLPHGRGLDSPTLVIRRPAGPAPGLYATFDSLFEQMWERRKGPAC